MAGRGVRRPSRTSTIFVMIGLLTILGSTFGAGVYTGRRWGPPVPARSDARKEAAERPKPPATPTLTFYQELTAPLTAPPPPKPVKAPKPEDTVVVTSRRVPMPASPEVPPPPGPPGGYTVQVGAYRARPPADALRDTLVAAGHEADVVENQGAGEARYRVRVGAYATREAARAAATRLGAERTLSTFVTTR
jgi:DedD protein